MQSADRVVRRTLAALVCCVIVAFALAPGAVAGAESAAVRFLTGSTGTEAAITFAVTPGVDLPLPFTAAQGSTIEIYVSPFVGEHGDVVSVQPSIAELPGATTKDQRLSFSVDRPVLTLRLKPPAAPMSGKYTGTLAILQQGTVQQSNRIVLMRAPVQRPAKVSVEPKSITAYEVGGLVFSTAATFELQVRNSTSEWTADGIFLRLLDVTLPAGANFDPTRNLKLAWNGQEARDLWRSPPPSGANRSIEPNRQAVVAGAVTGLEPGEYTIKIGVGAANTAVDGEQQVTLKLFVKHGPLAPFIVLLFAIFLSYVATKGLEAQRKRVSRMKKVEEIKPAWLGEESPTLPVVAARVILKQVENRNREWYDTLFGQEATGTLIGKAERLLNILSRVHGLRLRINAAGWDRMIGNRAVKRLNGVVRALNPDQLDESTVGRIEAELGVLEQWFDPKQRTELYRIDLISDMDGLAAQVNPEAFGAHRDLVSRLRDEILKNRSPSASLNDLIGMEETYAKLKILWERNRDGDSSSLDTLAGLLGRNQNMSIEEFFDAADRLAWEELREADSLAWEKQGTSAIEFVMPGRNDLDPLQAYRLIRFEVAPRNRKLGNNYLFKHKVRYLWTLTLETERGITPLTQPRTDEPRLVQYIPAAGRLYVSVVLQNEDESLRRVDCEPLRIEKSGEYGWMSAFRFNEVIALGIATIFALVSGLATFYAGKHAFGAIGDYIALFLWGAGVDQTKNFIQNLERTSPGS